MNLEEIYLPARLQGRWLDGTHRKSIWRCFVGVRSKSPRLEQRVGRRIHSRSEQILLGTRLKSKHFACILPNLACTLLCTTLLLLNMPCIHLPTKNIIKTGVLFYSIYKIFQDFEI